MFYLALLKKSICSTIKKKCFYLLVSLLEPYDLLLLTIIKNEINEFNLSDNYEEAYQVSVDNGFAGEKDEFAIIINKLEIKFFITYEWVYR